jgi:putative Mg2+ transporter-C (MgtC) family protein
MDTVEVPAGPVDVLLRLLVAMACGFVIGVDRELADKPAGIRTHALVALGTALFGVSALQLTSANAMNLWDPASRVLQGVIAGVGFVGGGVILRREKANAISGLTTAASLWVAAALGVASALGLWIASLFGAVLALIVLVAGRWLEGGLERWRRPTPGASRDARPAKPDRERQSPGQASSASPVG